MRLGLVAGCGWLTLGNPTRCWNVVSTFSDDCLKNVLVHQCALRGTFKTDLVCPIGLYVVKTSYVL